MRYDRLSQLFSKLNQGTLGALFESRHQIGRMRHNDNLAAVRSFVQQSCERTEKFGMEACFRLVEDDQLGWPRRKQGGGQQQIAKRAIR